MIYVIPEAGGGGHFHNCLIKQALFIGAQGRARWLPHPKLGFEREVLHWLFRTVLLGRIRVDRKKPWK